MDEDKIYYSTEDGEIHGPLTRREIKNAWLQERLSVDTLLWTSGQKDWTPLRVAIQKDGFLQQTPAVAPAAPTPAAPPAPQPEVADIYAALGEGRTICGPFSPRQLREMYVAGTVTLDTLLWTHGRSMWMPYRLVSTIGGYAYVEGASNASFALLRACANLTFRGRTSWREYWSAVLQAVFVFIGLFVLAVITNSSFFGCLMLLSLLAMFVVFCPLTVRRLHDIGCSGATLLIGIIVPPLMVLVGIICLAEGNSATNEYGPPPVAE